MSENRRSVLLVEDNEDDVFLMRRALRKSGLRWDLQVLMDGQEALDYLKPFGKYVDRNQFPRPWLVFLDLKLPYVSGFEVLAWTRGQPSLTDVPIVVLTSSPEERDEQKALALGAKAYLLKPPTQEVLQKIAESEWATASIAELLKLEFPG